MNEFINKLKNDKDWLAFLKFIDASNDFYSLTSAVNNFIRIDHIRYCIQIEELAFIHDEFDTHITTAREIKASLEKLTFENNEYELIKPQGTRRRDKIIGENPLYAMLTGNGHQGKSPHDDIWCQYAFVILATVHGYQKKVADGEIKHASTNTVIGMRGVRDLEKFSDELTSNIPLPQNYDQFPNLIEACEGFFQSNDNDGQQKIKYDWLPKIIIMLNTFEENKEGYSRRYRCKVMRTKKIEDENLSDENDESGLITKINSTLDEKTKKNIESIGMVTDEFTSGEGVHDKKSTQTSNVVAHRVEYKKMSGKRNAIIHLSQSLFYRHNTLSPREVFGAIESLKQGELFEELKQTFGIETLSLFGLLIFTGRSIESISTLRFLKEKSFLKSPKPELTWLNDKNLLAIPTKIIDVHNKLDVDAKNLISIACGAPILARRECYEINMPSVLQSILSEHFKYWKTNYASDKPTNNDARTIAFTNVAKLDIGIKALIQYLNGKFHIRLTVSKIKRLFEQSFLKISDDQAEYSYITGERINHSLASAHYFYVTPANLHTTHTFVINQILSYASQSNGLKPVQASLDLIDSQNLYAIGSKLVLNSELIQHYVKSMKQIVADSGRNKTIIQKHNYFVFYCIKLLAYATGYRAVGDPFDHISQLNRELGLMVISDKDFDDHFHTRVVPVSNLVLKQLSLYDDHLKQLKKHLGAYPTLLKQLRQIQSKSKPNENESSPPYLFFLTEKMRILSISPKSIKSLIPLKWHMPDNINRHYLRSEIVSLSKSNIKLSVSSECLDYFMGHWGTGEEPFNKHAMVSPMSIKVEIQPIIDQILSRDGWTAIKGPVL